MAVFREGDILVDIGAHVGVMSIYLAKRYPFIKVYALEPDPVNYACLIRNLELNGVTNVTAINTAVSGDGGRKTLYVDVSDSAWATTDASLACSRGPLRVEEVASVTLEELFDKHEIRHCRLLKITAPGSVLDILKGFNRSGCVDLLCGEADFDDGSRAKLEVASWSIARQHFFADPGQASRRKQCALDTSASDRMRRPTSESKTPPVRLGLISRLGRRRVWIERPGKSVLTYLTHSMTKTTNSLTRRCVWSRTLIGCGPPSRTCREKGVGKYVAALDGPP